MIRWDRTNVYKLVSIFGDGLEHPWMEVINIGTRYFLDAPINTRIHKTHQAKFEAFLKKGVNYGLIKKVDTKANQQARRQDTYMISEKDYNYKITTAGDIILRHELGIRSGDHFYAQLFDRSIDGAFGVDKFAPLPRNLKKINDGTHKSN